MTAIKNKNTLEDERRQACKIYEQMEEPVTWVSKGPINVEENRKTRAKRQKLRIRR
jgi:hypothetical protein